MICASFKGLKVAVFGLCLAAAPVFAGPIGSLVVDGSATIHVAGNGSAVEARGTHTVFAGDRIDTSAAGARLMLRDGSVISLAPASSLTVRSDVGSRGSVELTRGRMMMDARSDDWSVLQAGGDRTDVSAGASIELEADDSASEGDETLDSPVYEPAARPRSIS